MSFDERIRKLYEQIKGEQDLSPAPRINRLFGELVREVTNAFDEKAGLSKKEERLLQEICSCAEYELERYWAERIIASRSAEKELAQFPYIKNYSDLTRLEWFSFQGCQTHKKHSVLFVGGGPMPLTAIMLAHEFGVSSTIIDYDKTAVELSKKLINRLGLTAMIKIRHVDAQEFEDYGKFSVIFVAALAGLLPNDKENIFLRIKQKAKKETHIIARSSWGNRKLLYRPLSSETYRHFEPVLRIDPYTDIVNSVVILKKT
jgi:nicotianamine synthase